MYRLYSDLFGPQVNAQLLDFALSRESVFSPSKTIGDDPRFADWRRSVVIFADQLGPVSARIEAAVRALAPQVLGPLGIGPMQDSWIELQMTAHGDGQYYHWHTDNGSPQTRTRALTFVYYLHALPKGFSGGELVIHPPGGERVVIEPRNDSMVFFAAGTRHEVLPVVCPGNRFRDGRFTLNGWVHHRPAVSRRSYFDQKVLGPLPSRSRQAPMSAHRPDPAPPAPARGDQAEADGLDPDLARGLLDHYSALWRDGGKATSIDQVEAMAAPDFFARHYYRNLPVVIRGALRDAPAVRTWTPDSLARRFGRERIEVTSGREADPDYETNFRQTTTTTTLDQLARRLRDGPDGNDFYMVARNNFFRNPAFDPLRQELGAPPDIVDASSGADGAVKLWIGPRGTITPLHFDLHSILFGQIHGRKRFLLIPPFDGPKLYVRRRFYSAVDPDKPDLSRFPLFARASVTELVVAPGDLLFLPAGWWHGVKSLDVSISATFSRFRIPGGNHPIPL